MPTKNPRFTITLDSELYQRIEDFRYEGRYKSQTQAVLALLERGLAASGSGPVKRGPACSPEGEALAQGFDRLDKPGQRLLQVVLREEADRVREEARQHRARGREEKKEEDGGEATPARSVPLFHSLEAVCRAAPVPGEDFTFLEPEDPVPEGTDFAVRLWDDSMAPLLPAGTAVYAGRAPLENGDVAVFHYEGDVLCRQYYRDEWGGVHLLCLNRGAADPDRYVPADLAPSLVCCGRAILPQRPALAVPEEDLL